ncbi:Fc.00g015650.m01.CDS01 [Cosmosporella sp. VM-42]
MLPQKFGSVRYKNHPAVRRATFNDSNLVALRYEKTAQAEPPIPVGTRKTVRVTRPPSSSSSSHHSHHHPIVVIPPLPVGVAPPTEEHPAFRTSPYSTPSTSPRNSPRRTSPLDEWKRDSGVARTNSSATIREECEEDEARCAPKLAELASTSVVFPVVQHDEDPFIDLPTPARPSVSSIDARSETISKVRSMTPPPAPAQSPEPTSSAIPSSDPPPKSASPKTPRSPRKLVKSMSSQSPSRFRTKSLSEVVHSVTQPMESLLRGSPRSTNSAAKARTSSDGSGSTSANKGGPKHPESPKSAKSSKAKGSSHFWSRSRSSSKSDASIVSECYVPIDVAIPTDRLLEDDFLNSLSFSKRGSIMFGNQSIPNFDDMDQRPLDQPTTTTTCDNGRTTPTTPTRTTSKTASNSLPRSSVESSNTNTTPDMQQATKEAPALMPPPDIRVMEADVEKESQKVRSLYTAGDGPYGETGTRHSYCERLEPTPEAPSEENDNDPVHGHLSPAWGTPRSGSSFSPSDLHKRHFELAGGLEDWEDIDSADIDRYGFINLPRPVSRVGTPTEMKSAQYSPRKRNVLLKRDGSGLSSPLSGRRTPTRKVSARSLNTQTSELSMTTSLRSSRSVIRQAGNMLPHNRDRRWMDEAGDMLNISPNLQEIEEEVKAEKITEAIKRKEWERSEKWRRMAKVVRKGGEGEGMEFEFDTKNPKLIERTWKGIPDRWRGAAWWSFLATSAKSHPDCATAEALVADFHRLQGRSSPDDVQIDLDVPRTISRHIMFRRRYRGGQRLLFRVLHAISIYFPDTGYVQGMASLAATLLCYFDEEKCFVMLARMWQLRGLARLYRPGFEELMAALAEFNTRWLNKEVASKLAELCIDTTAYGTRWYLTLFNLSIPFPAQLRVWDVFILLGDGSGDANPQPTKPGPSDPIPTGEYDILHATSAALAQALREVLLDSDFENAMKALTSWIPITDEDLLMKVTKAEWKTHHGKKKA